MTEVAALPAVALEVENHNEMPVAVRIFDPLPAAVDGSDVAFERADHADQWQLAEEGTMEFSAVVDPGGARSTGYFVEVDSGATDRLLAEPDIAAVLPLDEAAASDHAEQIVWRDSAVDAGGDAFGSLAELGADQGQPGGGFDEVLAAVPGGDTPEPDEDPGADDAETSAGGDDEATSSGAGVTDPGAGEQGPVGPTDPGSTDVGESPGESALDPSPVAPDGDGAEEAGDFPGAFQPPVVASDDGDAAEGSAEARNDGGVSRGVGGGAEANGPEPPVRDGSIAAALLEELESGEHAEDVVERLGRELGVEQSRVLNVRVEHLTRAVNELMSYTDALEAFLEEEGTAMEALTSVRDQATELEGDVASLETDLAEVSATVSDRGPRLDTVERSIAAVGTEVEALQERTERLANDLADARDRTEAVSALEEEVDALTAALEEGADARTAIADDVAELARAVDAIAERDEARAQRLDDLEARVDSVAAGVESLEGETSDLRSEIEEVGDSVRRVESIFETLAGGTDEPAFDERGTDDRAAGDGTAPSDSSGGPGTPGEEMSGPESGATSTDGALSGDRDWSLGAGDTAGSLGDDEDAADWGSVGDGDGSPGENVFDADDGGSTDGDEEESDDDPGPFEFDL